MRRLLLLLGFFVSFLGLGVAATRVDAPTPRSRLEPLETVRDALARPAGPPETFFLGDSTAIWYPPGRTVPERLEQALRERGEPGRVVSLGYDAMFPFDYYALADRVARERPARVVLAVNFFAFSPRAPQFFARPAVAAWISPARWPRTALLPLHWARVRFDQLVFDATLLRLGGLDLWLAADAAALRVGEAFAGLRDGRDGDAPRDARDRWIRDNAGLRGRRQWAEGALDRYGPALRGLPADHPVLAFLGAAVDTFRAADVPVVVYLVPFNVDHLAKVGVLDEAGLARSIAVVRRCVETRGGRLLDLHDLLRDDWFRDPAGHFTHTLLRDGPQRVARALAREVARQGGGGR